MKISITYIDGTTEIFNDVYECEEMDNFIQMQDDAGNAKIEVLINQIRKIEYD